MRGKGAWRDSPDPVAIIPIADIRLSAARRRGWVYWGRHWLHRGWRCDTRLFPSFFGGQPIAVWGGLLETKEEAVWGINEADREPWQIRKSLDRLLFVTLTRRRRRDGYFGCASGRFAERVMEVLQTLAATSQTLARLFADSV